MMVTFAQQLTNLYFVGHLNDTKMLVGVGMGNIIINCFIMSIMFGLNGALDTLVPQAYGLLNFKQCGNYLNRGRLAICIYYIISLTLFFNISYLLKLID